MVAVSVIVATADPGAALQPLVRSIDAQTLSSREVEVVFADASSDGSGARLRDLAARRPNVLVQGAAAGTSESDLLALGRAAAGGEFVLELSQRRRLAPRALEVLLARARRSGADAVLGRVVGSGASGLPDDADRADASAVDRDRVVALVRRVGAADGPVAVERRYAAAIEEDPSTAAGVAAAVRWSGDALHVEPEVEGPGADRRVLLVLRRDGEDLEVPVDGSGAAVLDPAVAEAGGPLEDGIHDLAVRVVTPDSEVTSPVLPPRAHLAAVIDGRPFVIRSGDEVAQLDVGATRTGVTGLAPQATATVVESVGGILLTLEQPSIHVRGDAGLDARLLLGDFPLRARLVCRDGVARAEALASSLAGVSRISLAVGGGAPVATGLRLRVDGVGAMTVEPVPAPRPRPRPAEPVGPPPLVQRVRRLAPAPLEPAVKRLSTVPVLRGAYRRLLKR